MTTELRQLYPEIEPYDTGFLDTGDGHQIYYEQSGNPDGIPIIRFHGGPGSRSKPGHRQMADPKKYRIILTDQRGSGLSTPFGSLKKNTTPHLVSDIEALRKHLQIEKWVLCGGSWGSTLIMNYLADYSVYVSAVVMWGLSIGSQSELDDLYHPNGLAAKIFPDAYEQFLSILTTDEQQDPLNAYLKITHNPEDKRYTSSFRHWARWEYQVIAMDQVPVEEVEADLDKSEASGKLVAGTLLALGYFKNKCYLQPQEIFAVIRKLGHIPTYLFHGRLDFICPITTAWQIHKHWPNSHFEIVPGEGHLTAGPLMQNALIKANDLVAEILEN